MIPSTAHTNTIVPSMARIALVTFPEKSMCPGVSIRLIRYSFSWNSWTMLTFAASTVSNLSCSSACCHVAMPPSSSPAYLEAIWPEAANRLSVNAVLPWWIWADVQIFLINSGCPAILLTLSTIDSFIVTNLSVLPEHPVYSNILHFTGIYRMHQFIRPEPQLDLALCFLGIFRCMNNILKYASSGYPAVFSPDADGVSLFRVGGSHNLPDFGSRILAFIDQRQNTLGVKLSHYISYKLIKKFFFLQVLVMFFSQFSGNLDYLRANYSKPSLRQLGD